MRKAFFSIVFLTLMALAFAQGQHNGEEKCLSYAITYSGMTSPYQDYSSVTPQYQGFNYSHVAAYYLGTTMHYTVSITNACKRTFNSLRAVGVEYYYEGNIMPGQDFTESTPWYNGPTQTFFIDTLNPESTVSFDGSYFAPPGTSPGLDLTRLILMHWQARNPDTVLWSDGRIILDDPHAGLSGARARRSNRPSPKAE